MLTSIYFFAEPLNEKVYVPKIRIKYEVSIFDTAKLFKREVIKYIYMYVAICFDKLNVLVFTETCHDFKCIHTYHIWSTLAISRHAKQTQDNLAMSSTSRYKKIFSTSSGGREIKPCFFLSSSEDIVRAWPK